MKICICGDSGLLGQALVGVFGASVNHQILGVSASSFTRPSFQVPLKAKYFHKEFDFLSQWEEAGNYIQSWRPDLIVNSVALTDISECEEKPDHAKKLNSILPEQLAELSRRQGSTFVHISTDHIFNGKKERPYLESDLPDPTNLYGASKLEGEERVRSSNENALIVRTNIVGFRHKPNRPSFAEWLCESLSLSRPISLFTDYVTSPIHVFFLAEKIRTAVCRKKLQGIYNMAGHNSVSKYRFGEEVAEACGFLMAKVSKGTLGTSSLHPPRPAYLALDVSRAESSVGTQFPSTEETAAQVARDFKIASALLTKKDLERNE